MPPVISQVVIQGRRSLSVCSNVRPNIKNYRRAQAGMVTELAEGFTAVSCKTTPTWERNILRHQFALQKQVTQLIANAKGLYSV